MKIFFSYGHDVHADFIKKVKNDLNTNDGIDVWIDSEELKAKQDWENELEQAIENSDEVVYFITPYSARRPDGYCLNELAFSIVNGKKITPVMVDYTTPPLSICRVQYIDVQDLAKNFDSDEYDNFLSNLTEVLSKGKELSQEGSHFNLVTYLKPIDFSADFKKYLTNYVGREWLYQKVDEMLQDDSYQVLWIKAEAGFGKTAFSTMLQHRHANAVGIHYCQYDSTKRKSSLSVLKTLIFQLSTQISAYSEFLASYNLSDINTIDEDEIIETFLLEPLNKIDSDRNYFFIIDAIDEAVENGKNKLADLIGKFVDLPRWMKIVITSRPEPYLNRKFSRLKTLAIDTASYENSTDLYLYIDQFVGDAHCAILQKEDVRETLVEKSEGNILYLKEVIDGIKSKSIQEKDIQSIPKGMDGLYLNMFERYFTDIEDYKAYQRPIFELMSSTPKKISLSFASLLLGWDEYDLEDALEPIGSIIEIKDDKIKFFHKSIADWIVDRDRSGRDFFVSQKKGHERIVKYVLKYGEKALKKLSGDFDDLLILLYVLYCVASEELDDERVVEIYEKIKELKSFVFGENSSISDAMRQRNIDGETDFVLNLESMDYEISKALVSLDESYMQDHIRGCGNYAHLLKEVGNLNESIKVQEYLLSKLRKYYEKDAMTWGLAYAEILNQVGKSYSSIGKMQEAIDADNTALSVIETCKDGEDHQWKDLYASCLSSLAVSYGNFDNVTKAIELEERSKEIIEGLYNQDNSLWAEDYIRTLNNLAIQYKDVGQTDKAVMLEESLLEIVVPLYESNPLVWVNDYSLTLNNLAFTYKSIGKITESISLEEKALVLTEALYQNNQGYWTHLYIKSLLNLALSYKNTWKLSEAAELEQKAIELTKVLYKQDKLRWCDVYTRSLTSLGITLGMMGEDVKAEVLEEESLSIRDELYKNNPQRWVDAYSLSVNNSAITYKKLGDLDRSYVLFSQNLEIRRGFYQNTPLRWSDHYTESLVNLALYHTLVDAVDKAILLVEEALEIKEKLYEENPDLWQESYSKNLFVYGYCHFLKNDLDKALEYEVKALKIRTDMFDIHNIRWIYIYALSLVSLASSYALNGDIDKAKGLQNQLKDIAANIDDKRINGWIDTNFSDFLVVDLVTKKDEVFWKEMKQRMTELELMQKKSPHRWSDAFK